MTKFILKIFLKISPIFKYKIKGKSMEPAFKPEDYVLVNRLSFLLKNPKIKDAVIARIKGKMLLKRIKKIENGKYFIVGDNWEDSYDSRRFGLIEKKDIIGKVLFKI